jgi:FKBP-type peptidyl-prolyl cis-trans isomerase
MTLRNIALAVTVTLFVTLAARYIQTDQSSSRDDPAWQKNTEANPTDQLSSPDLKYSGGEPSALKPPSSLEEKITLKEDHKLDKSAPAAQVVWKDIKIGGSKKVEEGSNITFHLVMKLMTGKVVADSYRTDKPWQGIIGSGNILFGLDRGLRGMYQGGRRAIWIPEAFAYGANGLKPQIPPNADLYAEVEVIAIF